MHTLTLMKLSVAFVSLSDVADGLITGMESRNSLAASVDELHTSPMAATTRAS
jgi:hypothetical protein